MLWAYSNSWQMRQGPERSLMEVLILKQMRACSLLREDVAYYDRLPTRHPDRSYTFLHAAGDALSVCDRKKFAKRCEKRCPTLPRRTKSASPQSLQLVMQKSAVLTYRRVSHPKGKGSRQRCAGPFR